MDLSQQAESRLAIAEREVLRIRVERDRLSRENKQILQGKVKMEEEWKEEKEKWKEEKEGLQAKVCIV